MAFELVVTVVVIAFDGRVLDRAVHSFDLPIGPGMIDPGEAMLDAILPAAHREHMRDVAGCRTVGVARRQSPGSNIAPAPDEQRKIWAADIQITPNGRFLYASERTLSTLAIFAVDGVTGKPTYLKSAETEKQPRGFRIDPRGRYLIAAGEKSDQIAVYRIDEANGDLKLLRRYSVGAGANWVTIAEMD